MTINKAHSNTSRIIEKAQSTKLKAKGLITNDGQYDYYYSEILKMFELADKLAIQKKMNKLKKLEKQIISLTVEILDYERFRMKNP